jgi:predicted nucleic acid-binding protein
VSTDSDVVYLDASALVKLVLEEEGSDALRTALRGWPRRVSSKISLVEVLRIVRLRDRAAEPLAHGVLARTGLIAIGDRVLVAAATVDPPVVGTLDAIHLASALRLDGRLTDFVSYDRRQLAAAKALGLPVASPR